jgi:type II secretory ATPase GspE/PulE/Tfp pilus assembly ATPase PilB-like protein|tara:strand:- start:300 stop:509 length:210 start_codon:yes stop_codon:yes gene_type:complete
VTPKQFALFIEKRASQKKITHMDAILDYCQEKEIEPDQITHLINRNLKEKIKVNAQDLHFLPKEASLPV